MNAELARFGDSPVLDQLVRDGWLVRTADGIATRPGLAWNHLATLRKDQKSIVLKLIQNPKTVHLLHHVRHDTSMDEPRRVVREIQQWRNVVPFLVCLNDKAYGDQLSAALRMMDLSVYTYSSTTKLSVDDGRRAIDAYLSGGPAPMFVTLANAAQLDKMLELLAYVQQRGKQYGLAVLDADQTYPVVATNAVFRSFIRGDEPAFHRLLLTGTEVMDETIYPECANAALVDVCTHPNFRSVRHAVWRTYPVQYGVEFVRTVLPDIDLDGRKVLIPLGGRVDAVVRMCTSRGASVLLLRDSLTLIRADTPDVVYRRGGVTKEHILRAVQKYDLQSVVLIYGNHPSGTFQSDCVWTDLILPQDDDRASAVRKSGRLSGVLPNTTLTVWSTAEMMRRVMTVDLPALAPVEAAEPAPAARRKRRAQPPVSVDVAQAPPLPPLERPAERPAEPEVFELLDAHLVFDSHASIPRRARPSEQTLAGVRAAMRRAFPDWYRVVREYQWVLGAPTTDVLTRLVQATVQFVPFAFDAGHQNRVTCVLDGEWAYAVVWNGQPISVV